MPFVRLFEESKGLDKFVLGGKGYGLVQMASIGLPVPPGLIISTAACKEYYRTGNVPRGLFEEVRAKLSQMERKTGKKLGDSDSPLLVSVRSGAPFSMPGMMDTILNLGLNDEVVRRLAEQTGDERFAFDAYRRFLQMYGKTALGIDGGEFEGILDRRKKELGVEKDTQLSSSDLRGIVQEFKGLIRSDGGDFPQDPWKQLETAVVSVFKSWDNPRAKEYRRYYKIPEDAGTAVNIQAMVFGNTGANSGSGVGFTRDPSTGQKRLFGEYLSNAQGEDVVAGIRTPVALDSVGSELGDQLEQVAKILEKHFRDMQDFEFTVERGRLYLLQTRNGKRTAQAAVKIAVEMVGEGLIRKEDAVSRIDPDDAERLLHRTIDPKAQVKPIAKGLNASPGATSGKVVLDTDEAASLGGKGEKIILVRPETTPEDIKGVIASQGVLTARGGMTCVSGDSWVLTDSGFMKAEEVYESIEGGSRPMILSYDHTERRAVWRGIIATGRRKSSATEVVVSQTGRSTMSTLEITPDHKMFTFDERKLVKKQLQEILHDSGFACVVDRIPCGSKSDAKELAYLAGILFTDGYISLKRTKGSVTFTQNPRKGELISTVRSYFPEVFGKPFNIERTKTSNGVYLGRVIHGTALDLICTSRGPAAQLATIRADLVRWVLDLNEISTLSFIAGAVDGDGSFSANRLQVYSSDESFVQALVVACLKLGIVPQVTSNRTIYNVQLVERLDDILAFSHRIKEPVRKRTYGSKLFAARSLSSGIADGMPNYRMNECVRRNLLIDARKLARYLLRSCPEDVGRQLREVISSDLRMYRMKRTRDLGELDVYNFEVDASDELDKNFVVFTSSYVPVLVSNSHAAVVARGMGKPAVVGCGGLRLHPSEGYFETETGAKVRKGEVITLDGTSGTVMLGEVPMVEPQLTSEFRTLLGWADEIRRLGVYANADTPEAAARAREFGAEGIGLCRTERMFNAPDRLKIMQDMISADTMEEKSASLRKLVPFQLNDFRAIFKEMLGKPVIVRLLDLPLHEFLPEEPRLLDEIAAMRSEGRTGPDLQRRERLLAKVRQLSEHNPMLGHRGCRLAVTFPEMYDVQVEAIIRAAIEVRREARETAEVLIMLPLISETEEAVFLRRVIDAAAGRTMTELGEKVAYKVGTMIETPRAALTAGTLATQTDFFSFGTNDLTQATFAFSRDDVEAKFMSKYLEERILPESPFEVLDATGVGRLIEIAVTDGRKAHPGLEVGICGEHGGEPRSIDFFNKVGLDYVSCSGFRIPVARLAAAQATISSKKPSSTV